MELIIGPSGLSGAVKKATRTLLYAVMSTKQAKHHAPVVSRMASDRRTFPLPIPCLKGPAVCKRWKKYSCIKLKENMYY